MVDAIGFFLAVSLLLYAVLAGADFGAGILECFLGRSRRADQRELLTHAMGPVWEANHIWLILAVVILFNGFPVASRELSIRFHLPLTLMLVGITLRGCAFTFRHYDAIRDRSEHVYSFVFAASSVLTPLSLGMILGGLVEGRLQENTTDYYSTYVDSWLGVFPIALGIFLCALFALLASVFLIGETRDEELRALFATRVRYALLACVALGVLIFAVSFSGFGGRFLTNPFSLTCLMIATFALPFFLRALRSKNPWIPRLFAAGMASLILAGWWVMQYPVLLRFSNGNLLTLHNTAAPEATLRYLLGALLFGSALIFPAFAYLLKVFKSSDVH